MKIIVSKLTGATLFFLVFALLFLLLNGCAPNPKSVLEEEKIKKGKEIYTQNCSSCHGESGLGKFGPPLVSAKIAESIKKAEEGSEVEMIILKGKGKMPAFEGKITHQEVHSLLSYLLSLQEE